MSIERLGTVPGSGIRAARSALRVAASMLNVAITRFDQSANSGHLLLRAWTPAGALLTAVDAGAPVLHLGAAHPAVAAGWEPSWECVTTEHFHAARKRDLDARGRLGSDLSERFPRDPPSWAVVRDDRDGVWVTNGALLVREADATREATREALAGMRRFEGHVWVAVTPDAVYASSKDASVVGTAPLNTIREIITSAPSVGETQAHSGRFNPGARELLRRFPARMSCPGPSTGRYGPRPPYGPAPAYGFDDAGDLLYILMPCWALEPPYVSFDGKD